MTVGELLVKFGLDPDLASFAQGEGALSRLWNGLATLAVKAKEATVALVGMVADTASYADSIDEASQKTGVNTTALQELAYAAQFSDLQLSDLTTALKFLSTNMVAAADPTSDSGKALALLGVSARDAGGKLRPTQDVLLELADAFRALPDGAQKSALATKLFGKAGTAMIPLLNEGSAGLRKLGDEAQRTGNVLSATAVQQGVVAADGVTKLKSAWQGLKRTIGAELLPALADAAGSLTAWIVENRKAIASGIVSFLRIVAALFRAVWAVVKVLAAAVGFLARNLKALGVILGAVVAAALVLNLGLVGGLIVEYAALGLAALVNGAKMAAGWIMALGPIALLAAGILLIVKYWGDVKAAAGAVADFIKGVFSGIFSWIETQVTRLANAAMSVKNFLAPSAASFARWAGPAAVAAGQQLGVPGLRAPVAGSKSVTISAPSNVNIGITMPPGSSPGQQQSIAQQVAAEVAQQVGSVLLQAVAAGD